MGELMLGSKPLDMGGDSFAFTDSQGRVFKASTCCYDRQKALKGYQPIYTFEPGDDLGDTPAVAAALVRNFRKGKHCKGGKDPLPMDEGHQSLMMMSQAIHGKIPDILILPETKDGAIVTYDVDGNEVGGQRLKLGGGYIMGLVCLPEDELEDIKKGKFGEKYSIAFSGWGGSDCTMINVALCQNPAKEGVPALSTNIRSGGKDYVVRESKYAPAFEGIKQENIRVKEKAMGEKPKLRVQDEALSTQFTDLLVSAGVSADMSSSLANVADDETATILIPIIQKGMSKDSTPADQPTDQSGGGTTPPATNSKEVENLKAQMKSLEKKLVEANPELDPAVIGAKSVFANAKTTDGKPVMTTARAAQLALNFRGLDLTKEQAAELAKRNLGDITAIPTEGMKSEKAEIDNSVDNSGAKKSYIDEMMDKAEANVDKKCKDSGKEYSAAIRSAMVMAEYTKLVDEDKERKVGR
jgi:hypothetical protein